MDLPFSVEEFWAVFTAYNAAIQPMAHILYWAAILCIVALVIDRNAIHRLISIFLCVLWFWVGFVYHLLHFTTLHSMGYIFALIFVTQGLLFVWYGVYKNVLHYAPPATVRGAFGSALLLYTLIIYPYLNQLQGLALIDGPTFATPGSVTLFTIGLLCFGKVLPQPRVVVIPIIWTIIGTFIAVVLDVPQDLGLVLAGVVAIFLLIGRRLELIQPSPNTNH